MKKRLTVQIAAANDYSHYDAIIKEDSVKLKYSKSAEWTSIVAGYTAVKIVSDGNGVDVTLLGKDAPIRLDYGQLEELRIALHLYEVDRQKLFGDKKFITKLRKFWN